MLGNVDMNGNQREEEEEEEEEGKKKTFTKDASQDCGKRGAMEKILCFFKIENTFAKIKEQKCVNTYFIFVIECNGRLHATTMLK